MSVRLMDAVAFPAVGGVVGVVHLGFDPKAISYGIVVLYAALSIYKGAWV